MAKRFSPMLALMTAALLSGNQHFSLGRPRMSEEKKKRYDEEQRQRAHALCPETVTEHEYVIKGERIMARNRKTALKIYQRRHNIKK